MHNAAAPNLGKIGVLVALESEAGADVLEPLGKQLAMHIAAAFPQALDADGLDAEVIERERKIAAEKAAESGKPADVQAKMVDGAVSKFAKENALLSQVFVMDNKTPIAEVVAQAGKDAGADDRAQGLCPLPARRRHREGRDRLRRRSRRAVAG